MRLAYLARRVELGEYPRGRLFNRDTVGCQLAVAMRGGVAFRHRLPEHAKLGRQLAASQAVALGLRVEIKSFIVAGNGAHDHRSPGSPGLNVSPCALPHGIWHTTLHRNKQFSMFVM